MTNEENESSNGKTANITPIVPQPDSRGNYTDGFRDGWKAHFDATTTTPVEQPRRLTLHYFTPSEKPDCCFICTRGVLEHPETPKHNTAPVPVERSDANPRCDICGTTLVLTVDQRTTWQQYACPESGKGNRLGHTIIPVGYKQSPAPAPLADPEDEGGESLLPELTTAFITAAIRVHVLSNHQTRWHDCGHDVCVGNKELIQRVRPTSEEGAG